MFKLSTAMQRGILAGLLALGASTALHAEDARRTLEDVNVTTLDGGRVMMTLTLSSPAPEPSVFAVDNPARLSLDLPDTHMGLDPRYRKVDVGNVRAIAGAEAGGRTRVVVELGTSAPYQTRVDGDKVFVTFGNPATAAAAAAQPVSRATAARGGAITNVDFRRGEKGEGRVIVQLSGADTGAQVREEGGKVIADFRNVRVPADLAKRLDVLDFATPAKYVDLRPDGPNAELVITPVSGQDFEHVAYQSGDQFTIELQPIKPESEQASNKPKFTGERISLSFQNVEVRSLLQIIADVAGTNMVISDSVKGTMAMRLENVPWDQALDIILKSKGLAMREQGNVMMVAPAKEIAAQEKIELETQKQKVDLAPLHSEIIQVNYAKASAMRALLVNGQTSLLSERGRVTVDPRTNTLLVLETRDKLAEIRDLVSRLDIPVRQVLIESRIVIANDDFARELGTRFGVSTIGGTGSTTIGQAGANAGARTVLGGGLPTPANNYIVNLPTQGNPTGIISWSILGKDFLVDLELSALQTEGRGEVISTPRVITANGKQARIEQGREIPYQTFSGNTGTSTSFKKAVLSLDVTPQITPDDRVSMDLAVSNDSQGANVSTGAGTAPAIDTRRLETQVLIKSGQTVVLGGVFQQTKTQANAKVPLLGDIPLLGALFRNNRNSNSKRELLIFVTPRVLKDGLTVK